MRKFAGILKNVSGWVAAAALFAGAGSAYADGYDALPVGYERLEYIESTGTQYLDSGFTPTNVWAGFWLDVNFSSPVANSNSRQILGSSKYNAGYWGGITLGTWTSDPSIKAGQFCFCTGGSESSNQLDPKLASNTRLQVALINRRYQCVDGSGVRKAAMVTESNVSAFYGSIYLGRIHTESLSSYSFSGKIYRFRLYDRHRVVSDFVPVKNSSGVAGLYDVVGTAGFRPSLSSDAFVAGPSTSPTDALTETSVPAGVGAPDGGFATHSGLADGDQLAIDTPASVWTSADGIRRYTLSGWKLYDEATKTVIGSGSGDCAYTHAAGTARTLVWEYAEVHSNSENLPYGYSAVGYIESTGTQYLSTFYIPDGPDFGFNIDLRYDSEVNTTSEARQIFGSSKANSGSWGGIMLGGYTASTDSYGGGQYTFLSQSIGVLGLVKGVRMQIGVRNRRLITSNGKNVALAGTSTANFCYDCYLGKVDSDTLSSVSMKGRFYRLELFNGDDKIAEFIPVVNPQGVGGMYDVVGTAGFRPSLASAAFVAGPMLISDALEVAADPAGFGSVSSGYCVLGSLADGERITVSAPSLWKTNFVGSVSVGEYACAGWTLYNASGDEIESSTNSLRCTYVHTAGTAAKLVWHWRLLRKGLNGMSETYEFLDSISSDGRQRILTGITLKPTTRLVFDFAYNSIPNQTTCAQVGFGGTDYNNQNVLLAGNCYYGGTAEHGDTAGGTFASCYNAGTWYYRSTGVANDTRRHVFDLAPGSQKFDGVEYATQAGATAEFGTLALFGRGISWSASSDADFARIDMTLYSCQIYEGETMVADFIPARRRSDSAVGLYDRIRDQFFVSAKTYAGTSVYFTPGRECVHRCLGGGLMIFVR